MLKEAIYVFIGSGLGGVARYGVSKWLGTLLAGTYPYGTISVNIVGCLLIGLANGLFMKGTLVNPELKLLLTVGFCGGFTTFSTFMNDASMMIRGEHVMESLIYMVLSITLGYLALMIGYSISK
ncbi:MAG: fluoride efflux transporter CrcB [Bacteroidales bacterium]|nr:fluoride efflux transporter CrcB [Bacteroidales bacterium]